MVQLPGILERQTSRRRALQLGGLSSLAALLNQHTLAASQTATQAPIRSYISLMLYGGPSHVYT